MPFEDGRAAPLKKIAVIGAGISGMGAAEMLAQGNRVVLFEAEARLGGHARTRSAGRNGDLRVDTGFIVFNYANYPNLAGLFDRLEVPVVPSDMSWGASFGGGRFEYGLRNLPALFAQPRNALDPRYLRMLRDLMRFNARGLAASREEGLTIGGLIGRLALGDWFRDRYLLPISGAIWSTPTEKILDFPAHAMMSFFDNHNLLQATGQHRWYTVDGGSAEYVRRLEASMRARGVDVRLSAPVDAVRRVAGGVEVKARGGGWDAFDDVVFATHSDDTLRLLSDATSHERAILGAVRYQPNRVMLHGDARVMPKRRAAWASWTYTEEPRRPTDAIPLTYWMNSLQPWLKGEEVFVTLNTEREIDPALIWDETVLHHPVYDLEALAAQEAARAMNGTNRTWFCGAWMKNGFHEDGLASAVDVVEAMQAGPQMEIAAQ